MGIRDSFSRMYSLTTLDNIQNLSGTTDMRSTFLSCRSLTSVPNIDTSATTSMWDTFRDLQTITTFPQLNTSNVTSFKGTWWGNVNQVSFPLLDMSSGNDFTDAFRACAFDSTAIDNIMQALVANGSSNLTTNISGGTNLPYASWSAQAQADHATLISRGWTITTN